MGKRLTEEQRATILTMSSEGASRKAMAEAVSFSTATIDSVIKAHKHTPVELGSSDNLEQMLKEVQRVHPGALKRIINGDIKLAFIEDVQLVVC